MDGRGVSGGRLASGPAHSTPLRRRVLPSVLAVYGQPPRGCGFRAGVHVCTDLVPARREMEHVRGVGCDAAHPVHGLCPVAGSGDVGSPASDAMVAGRGGPGERVDLPVPAERAGVGCGDLERPGAGRRRRCPASESDSVGGHRGCGGAAGGLAGALRATSLASAFLEAPGGAAGDVERGRQADARQAGCREGGPGRGASGASRVPLLTRPDEPEGGFRAGLAGYRGRPEATVSASLDGGVGVVVVDGGHRAGGVASTFPAGVTHGGRCLGCVRLGYGGGAAGRGHSGEWGGPQADVV